MDLMRPPDLITSDAKRIRAEGGPSIRVSSLDPVSRVHLRWSGKVTGRVLGDAWERSYEDLEWRGLVPERPLPWYFLVHDGARAWGAVVELGDRTLEAASIVTAEGDSPFDTALRPHSAEPLDWMETTCPSRWNLDGEVRSFDWFGKEGTRCVEVQ